MGKKRRRHNNTKMTATAATLFQYKFFHNSVWFECTSCQLFFHQQRCFSTRISVLLNEFSCFSDSFVLLHWPLSLSCIQCMHNPNWTQYYLSACVFQFSSDNIYHPVYIVIHTMCDVRACVFCVCVNFDSRPHSLSLSCSEYFTKHKFH